MPKITVHANPKCKYCLGKGLALVVFGGTVTCSCVTEQLLIVTYEPDYSIPEGSRYSPGLPQFLPSIKEGQY